MPLEWCGHWCGVTIAVAAASAAQAFHQFSSAEGPDRIGLSLSYSSHLSDDISPAFNQKNGHWNIVVEDYLLLILSLQCVFS